MNPYIIVDEGIRNEVLDLIFSKLDRGQGCPRGALKIYTSGGPDRGTLLATLYLNLPAFSKAVDGIVESYDITPDTNAGATGTAAYFELVDRDNNRVIGGSVGPIGSKSLIELNKTNITAGDTVSAERISFSIMGGTKCN